MSFVAIKMGRRQGGPSRTGIRGRISEAIRNRRATQPPAHFHRNPAAKGMLFRGQDTSAGGIRSCEFFVTWASRLCIDEDHVGGARATHHQTKTHP